MKAAFRRTVVLTALIVGLGALAASSAAAQQVDVERVYTGVATPVLAGSGQRTVPGAVLAGSGERPASAIATQVLPLQVSSGGGVAATAQGRAEGLAFTGTDVVTLVSVALFAMTLGVVLTRRARPRPIEES